MKSVDELNRQLEEQIYDIFDQHWGQTLCAWYWSKPSGPEKVVDMVTRSIKKVLKDKFVK